MSRNVPVRQIAQLESAAGRCVPGVTVAPARMRWEALGAWSGTEGSESDAKLHRPDHTSGRNRDLAGSQSLGAGILARENRGCPGCRWLWSLKFSARCVAHVIYQANPKPPQCHICPCSIATQNHSEVVPCFGGPWPSVGMDPA